MKPPTGCCSTNTVRRTGSAKRTRREVLGAVVVAAGSTCGCARSGARWRFLAAEEAATLAAVCDVLIPADQDPGAAWAGAVTFLDRQLSTSYRRVLRQYRSGLMELDRTCVRQYGRPFVQLTPARQAGVLQAMERESAPFFELLLAHTQQSFYGSPRHGGNRDAASWKMLGVPYPPVRGRNPYDRTLTPSKPA